MEGRTGKVMAKHLYDISIVNERLRGDKTDRAIIHLLTVSNERKTRSDALIDR